MITFDKLNDWAEIFSDPVFYVSNIDMLILQYDKRNYIRHGWSPSSKMP